jgi:hypothetical protein
VESADRATSPYTKRTRLKNLHSKCPRDNARSTQRVCFVSLELNKKLRPCTLAYLLQNTVFPTEQSMSGNHDFLWAPATAIPSRKIFACENIAAAIDLLGSAIRTALPLLSCVSSIWKLEHSTVLVSFQRHRAKNRSAAVGHVINGTCFRTFTLAEQRRSITLAQCTQYHKIQLNLLLCFEGCPTVRLSNAKVTDPLRAQRFSYAVEQIVEPKRD